MDQETCNDLRRKFCLTCKEPWELGHVCPRKGKACLIEVHSDVEDEHISDTNSEGNNDEVAKAGDATCGIIATIFGETRHQPFVLTIIVTEQ